MPMKLYIILEKELNSGLKMAQACHAMAKFGEQYPIVYETWYTESNNIVILQEEDIGTLAVELEELGFKVSRFFEPDCNDMLTAIAVEPAAWKLLSTLPLAA